MTSFHLSFVLLPGFMKVEGPQRIFRPATSSEAMTIKTARIAWLDSAGALEPGQAAFQPADKC